MKKSLLLIFTLCSFVWLQVEASSNGTIVNGQYVVEDFENYALDFAYPKSVVSNFTVLIKTSPNESPSKTVWYSTGGSYVSNSYVKISVTLPQGKVLSDFQSLSYSLYLGTVSNKKMTIWINGNKVHVETNNTNGSNTNVGVKTTAFSSFNQTGAAGVVSNAGNVVEIGIGLAESNNNTNFYIDNVRLSYTLSTAPIAIAADEINATSFKANWEAIFGVENYRLDVATDASFTNMVLGYNNLNVGNVLTYEVSGLDQDVVYYYRVRGEKSDGTSPSSSTISVLTQASGPVDPYVAPNLDPVAETDPTPATITVPTVFVIDDFESYAIDYSYPKSVDGLSALVKTSPTNPSGKAVLYSTGGIGISDSYIKKSSILPDEKVLSNYQSLSFDLYLVNVSHKQLAVWINGTKVHQEQFNGTNSNLGTKTLLFSEFNQSGAATAVANAGNNPEIGIGITDWNNNTSFYIDNIQLNPGAAPTGTTATAATHINATSFKAQWSLYQGSTGYFLDVSTNSGFSSFVSGYENLNVGDVSNYVVTGLNPNTTYYYRVRGTNTSSNSNTITVATKAGTTTTSHFATRASGNISDIATWQSSLNNTGWMNATAAPSGDAKSIRVLKDHELTVDDDFSGAEIIVRAGGKLNVASGKTLSLSGRLFLESSTEGTATLVNDGTVTIGEDAIVKQYLTAGRNWYFASPVSNATSEVIKGTVGNQLWARNVAGNSWAEITATDVDLTPGRGYIAKVDETGVITFTGALNNGQVQYPIESYGVTSGKFHLVGNPYPSYLDWQTVVTENADVMPTMWFRTMNEGDSYMFATVLMSGGSPIISAPGANTTVSKLIPSMQAFWVRIKDNIASTDFVVDNTMRSHADVADNRFKAPASLNQLLRLEVANDINKDETILYFNTNASDGFDLFDAPKMFNNNPAIPEIYTRVGNERLVINGLNSYSFNTRIPLWFNTGSAGNFTIRASQLDNFDANTRIVLVDQPSNTEFDLTEGGAYSFNSDAINADDRFVVVFRSASGATGIENAADGGVFTFTEHGRLGLQLNTLLHNANVTVYNLAGQSVFNQQLTTQITLLNRNFESGVYLLKIENDGRMVVLRTVIN